MTLRATLLLLLALLALVALGPLGADGDGATSRSNDAYLSKLTAISAESSHLCRGSSDYPGGVAADLMEARRLVRLGRNREQILETLAIPPTPPAGPAARAMIEGAIDAFERNPRWNGPRRQEASVSLCLALLSSFERKNLEAPPGRDRLKLLSDSTRDMLAFIARMVR